MGIDNDTYKNWIEFQVTPEMNWFNIEIDHVKPFCLFVVSINEGVKQELFRKNIQTFLNKDHQYKGTKFSFLDYQLLFIKAYQFLRINDEGNNKDFHLMKYTVNLE